MNEEKGREWGSLPKEKGDNVKCKLSVCVFVQSLELFFLYVL